MIPVNAPLIMQDSKDLVAQSLSEGWISSAGPYVERFEREFARYLGVKHAISVSSGTAALHIALLSAGIGEGDEVIVPAFTMASTWMAVMYCGATPIFVDVEKELYTIDPSKIESAVTSKTKAIMPVHIYGHPADMDEVNRIAKQHKLLVIEDAAEAHGAKYKNKLVGTLSDISIFSFYANKIITTGEGGMVVTDDDRLASRARSLRDLAHSLKKRFIHDELGYNYRITSMQSALGIGQLRHVEEFLAIKRHMASLYAKHLHGIPGLHTPVSRPWAEHVYWMYAITIDESEFGMSRDDLRAKLLDQGVDTRDFFYPPSDQPLLRGLSSQGLPRRQEGLPRQQAGRFPIAESISQTGLYLPSGLAITDAQIETVCETIRSICHKK